MSNKMKLEVKVGTRVTSTIYYATVWVLCEQTNALNFENKSIVGAEINEMNFFFFTVRYTSHIHRHTHTHIQIHICIIVYTI